MRLLLAPVSILPVVLAISSCGSGGAVPDRDYRVRLAAMPGAFLPMATSGAAESRIRIEGGGGGSVGPSRD